MLASDRSDDAPITHGGFDRSYKVCKCGGCGTEALCTPSHDFYTLTEQPDGLLYCFHCLIRAHENQKST